MKLQFDAFEIDYRDGETVELHTTLAGQTGPLAQLTIELSRQEIIDLLEGFTWS